MIRTAAFALACCQLASAQEQQAPDLHYRLALHPTADRTELHVELRLTGDADGETRIALPNCRYGTPRLWRMTKDVRATGAELAPDDAGWLHTLTHEPGAELTFAYTLAIDPTKHDGYAYRPSTGPDHLHVFDEQWRARVRDRERPQHYRVEVTSTPEGWVAYSNLGAGPGPWSCHRRERDMSAFFGAGRVGVDNVYPGQFDSGTKKVGVYLRGLREPQTIVNTTKRIVADQARRFGPFDSDADHYTISIFPRERIHAGTAIQDAFICYARPDSERAKLEVLIAHEFFHNWLPRTGAIDVWRNGTTLDEFRLDWFHEGYTEYLARRMLLDSGRVTKDRYVEFFNQDLEEQAKNKERNVSLEGVKDMIKAGGYSNFVERTSYFRGPLIALRQDRELRSRGSSMYEVLKKFFELAKESDGLITEDQFFELLESFDLDARADYDKHVVQGEPPTIAEDSFGEEFVPKNVTVYPYERGFDLRATRNTGEVAGVKPGSAAEKAGLQDGQKFVSYERLRDGDRPITVRVKVDGAERIVTYLPRAEGVPTVRFVRRDK